MKNFVRLFSIVAILFVLAPRAPRAQEFQLNDRNKEKLGLEAREAYEKGVRHMDVFNYENALDRFVEAKELAPANHRDIRFLVGDLAFRVGRNEFRGGLEAMCLSHKSRQQLGEKARDFYDKGVERLDHVDPEGAFEFFRDAMNEAPGHQDLRDLAEYVGDYLAGKQKINPSVIQLRKGVSAFNELLDMKSAGTREKKRAMAKLIEVEKRINTSFNRAARWEDIGNRIVEANKKWRKEILAGTKFRLQAFMGNRLGGRPGRPPRMSARGRGPRPPGPPGSRGPRGPRGSRGPRM